MKSQSQEINRKRKKILPPESPTEDIEEDREEEEEEEEEEKIEQNKKRTKINKQQQHLNSRTSPDIEIIQSQPISSNKMNKPMSDDNHTEQDSLPSPTEIISSKSQHSISPSTPFSNFNTPTSSHFQPEAVKSEEIKKAFTDLFRFLILDGPEFSSPLKTLQKMAQSAQACLEEEPDETIYQTELEEKNLQLKDSQNQLDLKLVQVADLMVQDLSHFIQAHLIREISRGRRQIAKTQSLKRSKILEQIDQLESKLSTKKNDQIDSISDKINDIQARLEKLESKSNQSTQNPPLDLSHLPNNTPKQPAKLAQKFSNTPKPKLEASCEEIKQFQNQLKSIQGTYKAQFNQLQSKLSTITAHFDKQHELHYNQLHARLSEIELNLRNSTHSRRPSLNLQANAQPSSLPNTNSKQPSPEMTKTPIINELNLTLSPSASSSQLVHPSRQLHHHPPLLPSQSHPKLTIQTQTAESSSPPTKPPIRIATSSNKIAVQPRPSTLALPNRASLDLGRQPIQHPSIDNISASPVHSNSTPHSATLTCPTTISLPASSSFSRNQLEDVYNYISNRLMKSSWFQDYSKSRLTEIYKQHSLQDLAPFIDAHLNQLGLNSSKITDLLKLAPDLNANTLPKNKVLNPSTPLNSSSSLMNIMPTSHLPSSNTEENVSIAELKEILSTVKVFSKEATSRVNKLEIKLANMEKLGIADHGNLLTLNTRVLSLEAQGSQLLSLKAGSEELYNMELRIQSAQQEAMNILRDEVARIAQSIHQQVSPPALTLPTSPETNAAQPALRPDSATNDLRGLTLSKIEHHILNKLMNGIRSSGRKVDKNQAMKESNGVNDPIEKEEVEAVDNDDDDDDDDDDDQSLANRFPDRPLKVKSSEDEPNDTSLSTRSMNLKNKLRWNKFFEFLKAVEDRSKQMEKKSKTVYHHHQHQHRHEVRMVLGINQDSVNSLDFLQINRNVESQVAIDSQSNQSVIHDQSNNISPSN